MIKSNFAYVAPAALNEAHRLKTEREGAVYLAGGTDYLPLLKYNLKNPTLVISLDKMEELRGIKEDEGLFIGAMTTLRQVCESAVVQKRYPSLAEAARRVASPQIRSAGTIGGNILQDRRCFYFNQTDAWRRNIATCFKVGGGVCLQAPKSEVCRALYYSDVAPALLSLGAEVELFDGETRRVPLAALLEEHVERNGFTGTHNYIVKGFYLPPLADGAWTRFYKYALRDSLNFAVLSLAVRCSVEGEGPVVKIIAGAAAPHLVELVDTQKAIVENFDELKANREILGEMAFSELTQKSLVIREAGLSVKTKRQSFANVQSAVEELALWWGQKD